MNNRRFDDEKNPKGKSDWDPRYNTPDRHRERMRRTERFSYSGVMRNSQRPVDPFERTMPPRNRRAQFLSNYRITSKKTPDEKTNVKNRRNFRFFNGSNKPTAQRIPADAITSIRPDNPSEPSANNPTANSSINDFRKSAIFLLCVAILILCLIFPKIFFYSKSANRIDISNLETENRDDEDRYQKIRINANLGIRNMKAAWGISDQPPSARSEPDDRSPGNEQKQRDKAFYREFYDKRHNPIQDAANLDILKKLKQRYVGAHGKFVDFPKDYMFIDCWGNVITAEELDRLFNSLMNRRMKARDGTDPGDVDFIDICNEIQAQREEAGLDRFEELDPGRDQKSEFVVVPDKSRKSASKDFFENDFDKNIQIEKGGNDPRRNEGEGIVVKDDVEIRSRGGQEAKSRDQTGSRDRDEDEKKDEDHKQKVEDHKQKNADEEDKDEADKGHFADPNKPASQFDGPTDLDSESDTPPTVPKQSFLSRVRQGASRLKQGLSNGLSGALEGALRGVKWSLGILSWPFRFFSANFKKWVFGFFGGFRNGIRFIFGKLGSLFAGFGKGFKFGLLSVRNKLDWALGSLKGGLHWAFNAVFGALKMFFLSIYWGLRGILLWLISIFKGLFVELPSVVWEYVTEKWPKSAAAPVPAPAGDEEQSSKVEVQRLPIPDLKDEESAGNESYKNSKIPPNHKKPDRIKKTRILTSEFQFKPSESDYARVEFELGPEKSSKSERHPTISRLRARVRDFDPKQKVADWLTREPSGQPQDESREQSSGQSHFVRILGYSAFLDFDEDSFYSGDLKDHLGEHGKAQALVGDYFAQSQSADRLRQQRSRVEGELNRGRQAADDARRDLDDQRRQLRRSRERLEDLQARLRAKEGQLSQAKKERQRGNREYVEGHEKKLRQKSEQQQERERERNERVKRLGDLERERELLEEFRDKVDDKKQFRSDSLPRISRLRKLLKSENSLWRVGRV